VGGNYALVWIDKCLGRTPNLKLRILHNIYEVVCESIFLFVAEMCGLDQRWKETDMAQEKFCKKVLRIPCAINKVAKLEVGRESRRVKISLAARYWCRVREMGKEESVRVSDKWQKENIKFGSRP